MSLRQFLTATKDLERDVVARFLHGFLCSASFFLGWFSPTSLSGVLRQSAGGLFGDLMISGFGVLAVLIWIDTWINDVCPPDTMLKWTSKHRIWLHVLPSVGNLSALMTVAMVPGMPLPAKMVSCYVYLGLAFFGLWISWRDTMRRPGHLLCGV